MFEAVKIQNAAIDAELTAKLRAKSTIPQESPRGLFGFRWAPPKFANARRGDFHGGIISGPLERGAMGYGDWAMGAMGAMGTDTTFPDCIEGVARSCASFGITPRLDAL